MIPIYLRKQIRYTSCVRILRAHVQIFPPSSAFGGDPLRKSRISCSIVFFCHLLKYVVFLEGTGCSFSRPYGMGMLLSRWTI